MIEKISVTIHEDVATELNKSAKREKWQNLSMESIRQRAEYCARRILNATNKERIRVSVFAAPTAQWNKEDGDKTSSRVFFVIDQLGSYKSAASLKDKNTECIYTRRGNLTRYCGFMGLYDDLTGSRGQRRIKHDYRV